MMRSILALTFLIPLVLLADAKAGTCPKGTQNDGSDERALSALGFPDAFAADRSSTGFREVKHGGRTFLRAVTDGEGGLGIARSATLASEAIDLSKHFLKLRLRIRGEGRIGAMEFHIGSGEDFENYYMFSVPVYTDPLFDPLQTGEWLALTLSFGNARAVGKPDLKNVRWVAWALRDDASASVEIDWDTLAAIPAARRGIVSFTFDDGYDEHLEVAGRLMKRHRFAGTAYVMPDSIGDKDYLTLDQLRELESLGWDIASHHAIPLTDLSPETLRPTLEGVVNTLHGWGFSKGPRHLAYPLGRHDAKQVVPATRAFFETARVASAGPETLPPADPYRLRAVNVVGGTTTPEDLQAIAENAKQYGHWAILMFHYLVDHPPTGELEYGADDFDQALALIESTGVAVKTVDEVWSEWGCASEPPPLEHPASPPAP